MTHKRFDGLGRNVLEDLAATAQDERDRLRAENAQLIDTLTRCQARCTSLLDELRAYRRSGICLKGWWCFYCGGFNGEGHSERTFCRACGKDKCIGAPPQLTF